MDNKNTTTTEIYKEDSTYIKSLCSKDDNMRDKLNKIINYYKENKK